MMLGNCLFFFFKQKTAYEMRISDWSSDVCSSDLGSLQQRSRPGRLYSDADDGHTRQRDHGADAGRIDDPGYRPGPGPDNGSPRRVLGAGRQLLDRQHHASDPQYSDDRALGSPVADSLSLPVPGDRLHDLYRRL